MKSKPLKVLVIRNANDYDFGGAETYALNLCLALQKIGHTSILVSSVPDLLTRAAAAKLAVRRGPWFKRQDWGVFKKPLRPVVMLGWYLYLSLWYIWLIWRSHIDVVHAHSRDEFISASIAGFVARKPVLWTDHADLKYILGAGGRNLVGRAVGFTSRFAAAIMVVSRHEYENVTQADPRLKNLVVVHNGVFNRQATAVSKPAGTFIIGVSARLVVAKGISELIAGYGQIASAIKTQLWLLGDGPDRKRFETEAAASAKAGSIVFFGYQHDPLSFVAAFDLFIHPSYSEGFSMAILEAAMLSKAVIATRVGGTPEIIQDRKTGLLIDARSATAITTALDYALAHQPEMTLMANQLGQVARQDYDFDRIVRDKIVPLYQGER